MNPDKTPSQLIDYIGNIIREREQKQIPTYYTISIEQFDKTTPVAEREQGSDNFRKQMLKYTSDYNLAAITVQLFNGKSRNGKAFQVFKVQLKKQNPTIVLGDTEREPLTEIQPLDSGIPVSRYYDEKFELQMRIMRTELEKQSLADRLAQLTDRYDEKLREQELRGVEKIKLLETQIQTLQAEIEDFEQEIARYEKDKHNSFGNIALGSIGSRLVETFAKSDVGIGVLKGLLGKAGYETLQGHLAGIEAEQNALPGKPTARILTEAASSEADKRQNTLNYILSVGQSLPDAYLRMLYDIAELASKNIQDLHALWNVAAQIKQQREKQAGNSAASQNNEEEDAEEDDDENNNNDDTLNLE